MERRLRGRWSCSCSVSHGTSCVCDFQRVCVFRRLPRNISFCSAICHTFHKTTRQYFAIRLEDIRVFSMIWSDVRLGSIIMDKRDGCKHTSIRLMRVCCLSFEISIHNIIFKESNRKKIGYHVFGHGNTIVAYTLKQFCILYMALPCFLDKESWKWHVFIWSLRRDVHSVVFFEAHWSTMVLPWCSGHTHALSRLSW